MVSFQLCYQEVLLTRGREAGAATSAYCARYSTSITQTMELIIDPTTLTWTRMDPAPHSVFIPTYRGKNHRRGVDKQTVTQSWGHRLRLGSMMLKVTGGCGAQSGYAGYVQWEGTLASLGMPSYVTALSIRAAFDYRFEFEHRYGSGRYSWVQVAANALSIGSLEMRDAATDGLFATLCGQKNCPVLNYEGAYPGRTNSNTARGHGTGVFPYNWAVNIGQRITGMSIISSHVIRLRMHYQMPPIQGLGMNQREVVKTRVHRIVLVINE